MKVQNGLIEQTLRETNGGNPECGVDEEKRATSTNGDPSSFAVGSGSSGSCNLILIYGCGPRYMQMHSVDSDPSTIFKIKTPKCHVGKVQSGEIVANAKRLRYRRSARRRGSYHHFPVGWRAGPLQTFDNESVGGL